MRYFSFILFAFFSKLQYGQHLSICNDAKNLKKELFILEYNIATAKNYRRIYSFKDFVVPSSFLELKKDKQVKSKLCNHVPKSVTKEIFNIRSIDMPYTSWLSEFENNTPDSVNFIKSENILQFTYFQDSLTKKGILAGQNLKYIDLWTVEPFIFSFEQKNNIRIMAIVGFHSGYKLGYSFNSRHSKFTLYEKKNDQWIRLETLASW